MNSLVEKDIEESVNNKLTESIFESLDLHFNVCAEPGCESLNVTTETRMNDPICLKRTENGEYEESMMEKCSAMGCSKCTCLDHANSYLRIVKCTYSSKGNKFDGILCIDCLRQFKRNGSLSVVYDVYDNKHYQKIILDSYLYEMDITVSNIF